VNFPPQKNREPGTENREPNFSFELTAKDSKTGARRGVFHTPRGAIQTPAFMPVGTLGTVKGLTIDQVRQTGAEMVLSNTYHLALRPGEEVVADLGGLHQFMGWSGPILTDSGGFQIYSLANLTEVSEEGARFRAHTDGRLLEMSPERSVEIQQRLGSDIVMVLDHVVELPNQRAVVEQAMQRSHRWAARCKEAHSRTDQALFGIVQGGLDKQLRIASVEALVQIGFDGYAIGGLSVGETPAEMVEVLAYTCPALPTDRIRYLMGVGRPEDLLQAINRGVDLFDCVMPTRNGRNAMAFTDEGPIRLRNQCNQSDLRPLQPDCPCVACRHSRGYLRHLFMSKEMLGPILVSIHNLTYYQRLLAAARTAIEQGEIAELLERRMRGWTS